MADEEEDEVTMVVEHFEMLTVEQMRKAYEGIKLSLKSRDKEGALKSRDKEGVGQIPTEFIDIVMGNSAEKIAELEKEYDFTDVPLAYRDQAKKWFKADKPPCTRKYGSSVTSAFYLWVKWNSTEKSGYFKGEPKSLLIKKRDEEAGTAMAAVGAAMAAVRLD